MHNSKFNRTLHARHEFRSDNARVSLFVVERAALVHLNVGLLICTTICLLVACVNMDFEIIGEIARLETIATGRGVRDRARLRKQYGQGRWRKLKGVARVRLVDGTIRLAEIHWYEAHGIGKKEYKLKLPFLDTP